MKDSGLICLKINRETKKLYSTYTQSSKHEKAYDRTLQFMQ